MAVWQTANGDHRSTMAVCENYVYPTIEKYNNYYYKPLL
jgi:hypothetical protein